MQTRVKSHDTWGMLSTYSIHFLGNRMCSHFAVFLTPSFIATFDTAATRAVTAFRQDRIPEKGLAELLVHGGVDNKVHAGIGYSYNGKKPVHLAWYASIVVHRHDDHGWGAADQKYAKNGQEKFDALHCSFVDVRRIFCVAWEEE